MADRASIVGAAETDVGKVRDHNEDHHYIDPELGIFLVCDGMGGHAAGEVASALAVDTIREQWSSAATQRFADEWLERGTHEAKKLLLGALAAGVHAAHHAILAEAQRDRTKGGMGTTLVGAMVVGGDIVFAHCGDSRAYIVRDGIAMQLTEDHTLLARLLAAGIDVDAEGDGGRFKSMLTNALGIGADCHVSTFIVPVADGDRFLLCSDGITEYVKEVEIGEVLVNAPSPARSAQKLVEMALDRGGGDNATALVVRVLEAGETARPLEQLRKETEIVATCALWAKTQTPQQRLRALRIAIPKDLPANEKIAASTLGDRVAWIVIDGEIEQGPIVLGPGALLYPEALLADAVLPDKDSLAVAKTEVRALALRADDFRELCEDDADLGELLMEALAAEIASRRPQRSTARIVVGFEPGVDGRGTTDPGLATARTEQRAAVEPPPDDAPPLDAPPEGPRPIATAPTLPPPIAEAKIRGETASDRPSSPRIRATSPPAALFVAPTDRKATEQALDRALSELTIDKLASINSGAVGVEPIDEPAADEPANDDVAPEIVMEADEPDAPTPATATAAERGPSIGDHSDAEISISIDEPSDGHARVEDGSAAVTETVKDTSSKKLAVTVTNPTPPEILVVRPGRAITANDAAVVGGTIEDKK